MIDEIKESLLTQKKTAYSNLEFLRANRDTKEKTLHLCMQEHWHHVAQLLEGLELSVKVLSDLSKESFPAREAIARIGIILEG